jgi:hypothetical protein
MLDNSSFFALTLEKLFYCQKLVMQKGFNSIDRYAFLMFALNFFTKVATIRLNSVADHVVRPTQADFMQERNILDGVVTLHETVHELHRENMNSVILKIDFEKA